MGAQMAVLLRNRHSHPRELISNSLSPEEIASQIGADSVRFLSIDLLKQTVETPNEYCFACFNGRYPIAVGPDAGICK